MDILRKEAMKFPPNAIFVCGDNVIYISPTDKNNKEYTIALESDGHKRKIVLHRLSEKLESGIILSIGDKDLIKNRFIKLQTVLVKNQRQFPYKNLFIGLFLGIAITVAGYGLFCHIKGSFYPTPKMAVEVCLPEVCNPDGEEDFVMDSAMEEDFYKDMMDDMIELPTKDPLEKYPEIMTEDLKIQYPENMQDSSIVKEDNNQRIVNILQKIPKASVQRAGETFGGRKAGGVDLQKTVEFPGGGNLNKLEDFASFGLQ